MNPRKYFLDSEKSFFLRNKNFFFSGKFIKSEKALRMTTSTKRRRISLLFTHKCGRLANYKNDDCLRCESFEAIQIKGNVKMLSDLLSNPLSLGLRIIKREKGWLPLRSFQSHSLLLRMIEFCIPSDLKRQKWTELLILVNWKLLAEVFRSF